MNDESPALPDFFPAQAEIFEHPARFKVVPKGRRFGMTRGAALHLIRLALARQFERALWVDTSYQNIGLYYRNYFQPVLRKLEKELWDWRATLHSLRVDEAWIDFRSADRPHSIEGFAYQYVFLNEAGIILSDEYLWNNAIQPMLLDYGSPALIAGTPKGKNLFHRLALKAEEYERENPDGALWKLFRRTTYDNPNINAEEIKVYEASIDAATARQEIYGEFVDGGTDLFAWAFERDRHVAEVEDIADAPLCLSFDFNVAPITCIAAQHTAERIAVLNEFRLLNSDIFALCAEIRRHYAGRRLLITGDASGQASSALTQGHVGYYVLLLQELGLPRTALLTPRRNPSHANSRALVNALLRRHENLRLHPRCRYLIEDLERVEVLPDGRIDKGDAQRGHLLDCFRYYLQTFHGDYLQRTRGRLGL